MSYHSYQSDASSTSRTSSFNLTTIDVEPLHDLHSYAHTAHLIRHKLRQYANYIGAVLCCAVCLFIGHYIGSSHNPNNRYISYADTGAVASTARQRYDAPLISAKDFETSTISPTRYSPTSHIVGTQQAVYEQYIPVLPTLFPVLRLAPTVPKKCTSELPVVELTPGNSSMQAHDSRYIEQQRIRTGATGKYNAAGSVATHDAAARTMSLHEYSNNSHEHSHKHRHHRHKHHSHHDHGPHSAHHIYHGHDDAAHHRHENDMHHHNDDRGMPEDPHEDHHHADRDDQHEHNRYEFSDHIHDIPPPTERFNWCFNCSDRCSNVIKAVEFQTRDISKRDRSMKLKEMAASLPRFFRGVDHLYLEDVFNLPYDSTYFKYSTARTRTFVSADQHLYNYGTFDNSLNEIIFDMNDFDQTLIDNYHIDLWRTATSLVMHMRINSINIEEQRRILYDFASTYYTTVASFVGNNNELFAYLHQNNTEGAVYETTFLAEHVNSRRTLLDKVCYYDSDKIRRLDDSGAASLEPVDHKTYDMIQYYWPKYLHSLGTIHRNNSLNHTSWTGAWQHTNTSKADFFTIKSIAKRVGAGLGSLGVPRYFVLVEGASKHQDDDILLDVKFEPVPEWWNFVHDDVRTLNGMFKSQGHRIATGIHALQAHVDSYTGWFEMEDGSYIVRPRSPFKAQVDVDALTSPIRFHSFAMHLAVVNAINHARADNDYNPALIQWSFEEELVGIVANDIDGFTQVLMDYAFMNADRITEDFDCFLRSGIADKDRHT